MVINKIKILSEKLLKYKVKFIKHKYTKIWRTVISKKQNLETKITNIMVKFLTLTNYSRMKIFYKNKKL